MIAWCSVVEAMLAKSAKATRPLAAAAEAAGADWPSSRARARSASAVTALEAALDAEAGAARTGEAGADAAGADMPVQAPWHLEDCGWVANRWCELLPLPPEAKQRLMELDNPLLRLELVGDALARSGITR